MVVFPCAKINLGLNVIEKRADGYHNLETVFYPIPLYDALETVRMDDRFPSDEACDLKVSGNGIDCNEADNLVVKAYNMIASRHSLARIHAHLCKRIPSQAGLGGGSSDAAFMIRALNDMLGIGLDTHEMASFAARLGADCPFFITAKPVYATGIGDRLSPIEGLEEKLKGFFLAIVKPDIAVSTKEAYSHIRPSKPEWCCKDVVMQTPIDEWKDRLSNDFEHSIFEAHPQLADIKKQLYDNGALYSQMSGSGSALFGIFRQKPDSMERLFPKHFTCVMEL